MDRIRRFGEIIFTHKILSSLFFVLILGGVLGGRYVLYVSDGQLSESIQRGTIVDAVYGIGTVMANRRFSLNPLVANTLRQSYVREGDRVKKGDSLVITDDGNIIRAPFDGIVNYSPYRSGENAYTSTPMMVLTNMQDRYVLVSMEQQGALRVHEGQAVRLSIDSIRQTVFTGQVAAVYSYANNFLARIDTVHLPDSVLPDMTCDVAIVIGIHENALLIPIVAYENGHVWVKRGTSLPRAVPIRLGVIDGVTAEVLEGDVQVGDRLVIRFQGGT